MSPAGDNESCIRVSEVDRCSGHENGGADFIFRQRQSDAAKENGEAVAVGFQRPGKVALSHLHVADPLVGQREIALPARVAGGASRLCPVRDLQPKGISRQPARQCLRAADQAHCPPLRDQREDDRASQGRSHAKDGGTHYFPPCADGAQSWAFQRR
jgi:hypothetical protein